MIKRNEMEGNFLFVEYEVGFGIGEEFEGDLERRDEKDILGECIQIDLLV